MREVFQSQMRFGEVAISDIEFDVRSRDEIPKLLLGLQAICCDLNVRDQVFAVLANLVPVGINPNIMIMRYYRNAQLLLSIYRRPVILNLRLHFRAQLFDKLCILGPGR